MQCGGLRVAPGLRHRGQQHPGLDLSLSCHPHCIFTTREDKDPRHKDSGTRSSWGRGVATKQSPDLPASYPPPWMGSVTRVTLCQDVVEKARLLFCD